MRTIFFLAILVLAYSLPVKESKNEPMKDALDETNAEELDYNLEYGRYLQEVIQALESDNDFKTKLQAADPEDIKSGKIARDLDFVDHSVRTKLDELKRREMDRLRQLAKLENEKKNGRDISKMNIPMHLDHKNPHKFEAEDLRKLIKQLNTDLEEADKQRHQQFKQYEMEKDFKYQQELKAMDEQHRLKAQAEHEAQLKKHKEHPKLHHPGSKQQLEEVWEEQDHLDKQDFNPKTFFHLHDLDGNGYWDENEVKALFQKELDKLYDPNAPEDDIHERYEEMERMREHVFRESDLDRDDLISFDEFMEQTKRNEYERDEGWQGLDEQELYSQQEYDMFQQEREAEIRRLIDSGAIPPPPGFDGFNAPMPAHVNPDQLHYQQGGPPQGYQQNERYPNQGIPQQGYPNPGAPQQGYPNQGAPQQGNQQQAYANQGAGQHGYANQGIPQQGYPNPGAPQQGYPNQGAPQQGYPNPGAPQQGYPNQGVPQQGNPQQAYANQGAGQQGYANQAIPQQGYPNPSVNQQGAPQTQNLGTKEQFKPVNPHDQEATKQQPSSKPSS